MGVVLDPGCRRFDIFLVLSAGGLRRIDSQLSGYGNLMFCRLVSVYVTCSDTDILT